MDISFFFFLFASTWVCLKGKICAEAFCAACGTLVLRKSARDASFGEFANGAFLFREDEQLKQSQGKGFIVWFRSVYLEKTGLLYVCHKNGKCLWYT